MSSPATRPPLTRFTETTITRLICYCRRFLIPIRSSGYSPSRAAAKSKSRTSKHIRKLSPKYKVCASRRTLLVTVHGVYSNTLRDAQKLHGLRNFARNTRITKNEVNVMAEYTWPFWLPAASWEAALPVPLLPGPCSQSIRSWPYFRG